MGGESFCERGSWALSPMKQLLFLEGSGANFLAFDIETYSPKGFPYLMEDPVVNFSLATLLKQKGVLTTSVLAEPCLESETLRLLKRLLSLFNGFCLLTYNGSKFDLEYVHHRGRFYGIDFDGVFSEIKHFDVYKAVREAFRLPNYGQKSVERFLGINRVVNDVNGACYHLYFDEFALNWSLKPMFYNIEDSFGCLKIVDAVLRRLKHPVNFLLNEH